MARLALLALLVLTACSKYGGMHQHAYNAAIHDYQCGEDEVTVRQIRRNVFDVRACGSRAIYQCHGYNRNCADLTGLAEQRAQAEYSCAGPVRAGEISPFVFAVAGCQQKILYHCEMRGGMASCAAEGAQLR